MVSVLIISWSGAIFYGFYDFADWGLAAGSPGDLAGSANLYLVCRVCLCFAGDYNFLGMAETLCHPAWPRPQASLYLSLPWIGGTGAYQGVSRQLLEYNQQSGHPHTCPGLWVSTGVTPSTLPCLGCSQGVSIGNGLKMTLNYSPAPRNCLW